MQHEIICFQNFLNQTVDMITVKQIELISALQVLFLKREYFPVFMANLLFELQIDLNKLTK